MTGKPKKKAAWLETPLADTGAGEDASAETPVRAVKLPAGQKLAAKGSGKPVPPANGTGGKKEPGRKGGKRPAPPSSSSSSSKSDSEDGEPPKRPGTGPKPVAKGGASKSTPAAPKAKAAKAAKPSDRLGELAGFKVLPITMPPLVVTKEFPRTAKAAVRMSQKLADAEVERIPIVHNLLFRRHESRKSDDPLPRGRTLFCTGIPADATDFHLANLFAECGPVERVVWGDSDRDRQLGAEEDPFDALLPLRPVPYLPHPAGTTVHVVFREVDSVDLALAMKPLERRWDGTVPEGADTGERGANLVGTEKWKYFDEATHPDQRKLAELVDGWIERFETEERSARLSALAQRNLTDEEGFTLVVRAKKGRNTARGRGGATVQSFRREDAAAVKPKKKELQDFYRFQIRQKKVGELVELRRKFEEDKKKIADMREKRKFRPY
ncbi:ribosomal RNA-processing protein 7-domain-containing protein [Hyaloraphidium curvatum]|nr:ribosomal RNA-processing protein 7-domain-containing protein [Hyaloraphidium curvatum]